MCDVSKGEGGGGGSPEKRTYDVRGLRGEVVRLLAFHL